MKWALKFTSANSRFFDVINISNSASLSGCAEQQLFYATHEESGEHAETIGRLQNEVIATYRSAKLCTGIFCSGSHQSSIHLFPVHPVDHATTRSRHHMQALAHAMRK
eukprot:913687-Prorocentrum_minimum.AAC.3